jgi:alpha-tubulin suppressor-like RCC1 family protein
MKHYCGQKTAETHETAVCKIMKARRNLIQIWLLCAAMLPALTSGAQPVTEVAGGNWFSLFLKSDGSLWAMGFNGAGQLGDGTYNNTNLPEQIVASNVTAIVAGYNHSLFLKSDGSLWAMGYNHSGQLGDGSTENYSYTTNEPEQIVASNVTAIAGGQSHSLFLKSNGSLWVMGNNQYGQLGDGTSILFTNRPEQIVASNVTAVAAGYNHSLFLKRDGSLWAMGDNTLGQLGDGTSNTFAPYGTNKPQLIVASNVMSIAAGNIHSLFLMSDGSLWAMGVGSALGDGTHNSSTNRPEQIVSSNVTALAAGGLHSLFLKNDGSLWAMGVNSVGQLGDGTSNNSTNQPEQIVSGNVTAIAAGGNHSLFVKSDGSLWAMGYNNYGQLGDGTTNNINRPEQILAGYNQICCELLGGTNMQLSFVGVANANYALDWSGSLSPANWIPQATNPAGSFGALVFTNVPVLATNNFWRIRSVP